MKTDQKQKIFEFIQDQIANADFRTKAYVFDEAGKRRLQRNCFIRLSMHVQNFLAGKSTVRWITMYGLRGAGKTTLLAQLYEQTKVEGKHKLFLSVDQAVGIFGVSLKDILEVYEEALGVPFERLTEPVFLFLDEVQYDEKWALLLKTIYDRSNKVFIIATGSSALSLQASPDVARRAIFEKLFPMSFTEYIKIKHQKTEVKGLAQELRDAIFNSKNAAKVHARLKALEPKARQYWVDIDRKEVDAYMRYGTLPFMISLNNEAMIYDQIKKTLERVVSIDIPHINQFSADTIAKIPMVLYALAETEQLSLSSLSDKGELDISRPVLTSVLETLERTETIWRIYPHGSHVTQTTRQPSKYLFTSPAFRSMYFNFIGNTRTHDNYKGKVLEDTVGLYLNRLFSGKPDTSVTYDSAAGGADFILRQGKDMLVLEVGYGDKTFRQVVTTMAKVGVNARYGIVVSQSPLAVDEEKNMVSIPLSYFLLA
ncbi:MAG: ATP-binding protein [Candidatus Paceibacterota bacterium]